MYISNSSRLPPQTSFRQACTDLHGPTDGCINGHDHIVEVLLSWGDFTWVLQRVNHDCRLWITWDRKRYKQESYECDNVIKCQNSRRRKVALLEIKRACNGTESYRSWNWVWHENTMNLGTVCKIWELNSSSCAYPQPNTFALHCFACSYQNNCHFKVAGRFESC